MSWQGELVSHLEERTEYSSAQVWVWSTRVFTEEHDETKPLKQSCNSGKRPRRKPRLSALFSTGFLLKALTKCQAPRALVTFVFVLSSKQPCASFCLSMGRACLPPALAVRQFPVCSIEHETFASSNSSFYLFWGLWVVRGYGVEARFTESVLSFHLCVWELNSAFWLVWQVLSPDSTRNPLLPQPHTLPTLIFPNSLIQESLF